MLYREVGDKAGEGNILWGLGSYYYFTADAGDGRDRWYRRSLELHRAAGQRTMEAWSLHMLSLSSVAQRHFDEARDAGRHALRHFYEAGDVAGVTLVLDDLAIVAVADGDDERVAGSGERHGTCSRRPGPRWPTTWTRTWTCSASLGRAKSCRRKRWRRSPRRGPP